MGLFGIPDFTALGTAIVGVRIVTKTVICPIDSPFVSLIGFSIVLAAGCQGILQTKRGGQSRRCGRDHRHRLS